MVPNSIKPPNMAEVMQRFVNLIDATSPLTGSNDGRQKFRLR
jgi:hypothetical protein